MTAEVGEEGCVMSEARSTMDHIAAEGITHPVDAFVASGTVRDKLADHRVIVRADLRALAHAAVHANIAVQVESGAALRLPVVKEGARRRKEAAEWVFRIYTSLQCPSPNI
eukprot:CAMPEP_0205917582 /NCGR_PEP_ID=MMETSP1325-20131115/9255_1 /ASSEMBLY_ACC=CAM_ASM_000708 /TAXON_ID=236786 /ORGANISM="Florenciella sp., Strain RCC1007" /LENGTH=110 /DNA_ID=CAMNT_0053285017 /DNA_START=1 /DNA_END=330 /DNA_ORIENTATION=+